MIPQRDLSLLSNRLAERGGRRIPEAVLERDYCLSWFLVGLSRSPLRDRLAFKGGDRAQEVLLRRLPILRGPGFHLDPGDVLGGDRAAPR
jgi:hypothetical protein